jgi:hypothetical protein
MSQLSINSAKTELIIKPLFTYCKSIGKRPEKVPAPTILHFSSENDPGQRSEGSWQK